MIQYRCINNDSGFTKGHIYDLYEYKNGYYILSDEGNHNVYTNEELDKWFEKMEIKIVDVNHGEKLNLLQNKLKEQILELPPCYQHGYDETWLDCFKQDYECFKKIMIDCGDDTDMVLLFIEKNVWKTKEFTMLKNNVSTTDFPLALTKIIKLAKQFNLEIE